jgi:dihydrolipoamide dehydrogenase
MGKYQARVAADVILGKDARATEERRGSPHVTFTDPQVAAVGMTLAAAKDAGINARAVDVDTDGTAGASFYGKDTGGTCRLVVDEDRRVIVGATFVGFETADFLQAATIAVVGEVPMERLAHAVPAFPSRSEIWLNLLEEYGL